MNLPQLISQRRSRLGVVTLGARCVGDTLERLSLFFSEPEADDVNLYLYILVLPLADERARVGFARLDAVGDEDYLAGPVAESFRASARLYVIGVLPSALICLIELLS